MFMIVIAFKGIFRPTFRRSRQVRPSSTTDCMRLTHTSRPCLGGVPGLTACVISGLMAYERL